MRVLGNCVSPVADPSLKSEIYPQNWLLSVGRDTLMNGVNILEKQHPSKTSDRQMCDVDFYAAKLGVKFWAPNGKPSVFRRGERFNGNWPEGHRSSFV